MALHTFIETKDFSQCFGLVSIMNLKFELTLFFSTLNFDSIIILNTLDKYIRLDHTKNEIILLSLKKLIQLILTCDAICQN